MGGGSGMGGSMMGMITRFGERQKHEETLQEQFHAAIKKADEKTFLKLLHDPAVSVNAEGGKPLQVAAEYDNFYFMRELVMAGADLEHAHQQAQKEYSTHYDRSNILDKKDPARNEAGALASKFNTIVNKLIRYQQKFVEKILPIELARLQKMQIEAQMAARGKMQENLESINQELHELNNGKPLPKKDNAIIQRRP